jgi:hypothetical protein
MPESDALVQYGARGVHGRGVGPGTGLASMGIMHFRSVG